MAPTRKHESVALRSDLPFIDELLPDFDVESCRQIDVAAAAETVYATARRLDMSSSWIIRSLFRLRGMPRSALNAEGLARIRFKPLLEDPPRGFVLGLVGQFWTPSGRLLDFEPREFPDLNVPGFAKAIWSFEITSLSPNTASLRTVTRVSCGDPMSRRSFMRYWTVIGPFSSLIRARMLRSVKRSAEGSHNRGAT
ncbi:MAG: hypothetical protein OEO79_11080 [Gemmatimonadota bacterium]|nr:hypothetical protein [Gemmatimonadota bacterium]